MATDIQVQKFREFILQEICEHLTPKDIKHLAYSQHLPPQYLTKDGAEVLLRLEILDKFSESNIAPLAEMMKVIGRKDLAKKVEKFKSLKKQKHCKKTKDIPVDEHTLKQYQIAASLKIVKLQVKMLLEQMEEVQATAKDIGFRRVEDEVADAIMIIEQQLQQQLSLASAALHMPQASTDSSLEDSCSAYSSLSSSEDGREVRSPEATMETPHRSRSGAISKPKSTHRDMITEQQSEATHPAEVEPEYELVEPTPLEGLRLPPSPAAGSLHYHLTEIVPRTPQDDSHGKLVVGRDGAAQPKQKPTVAPKPTIKKLVTSTSSSADQTPTADYTGGSTSTGDSGFVDSRKYRKDCPPPKVAPRHKYTQLNAEQREIAACYAATNCPSKTHTQDGVYDDVTFSEESPYVNIPILSRSNSN